MITISELRELFSSSSADCILYRSYTYEVIWHGTISEIPQDLQIDDKVVDLYDATYETRQEYRVDFEICVNM